MSRLRDIARGALALAVVQGDPCRIWFGDLRGRMLPRSIASRHLSMALGLYEPAMQRLIAQHVAGCSCAYDIGAHVGFFTLFMAATSPPSATVLAFEPTESLADQIEAVVRCNSLAEKVRVLRLAVSDSVGKARFLTNGFVGILDKAVESRGRVATSPAADVSTVSIDALVYDMGHPAPDFLKIDVESAEPLVLAGAKRVIDEHRPRMLIEVHGPRACEQTITAGLRHGYRMMHVSHRGNATITRSDQLATSFRLGQWTTHVLALPE